jgi:predicted Kef-type K+ transport protein
MVFFFLAIGLIIISLPLYLIGKKYSMAIELIIPLYGIYLTCFLFPIWYENPRTAKKIAGASLLQAGNFTLILNLMLVFFFNSNFIISVAGRSLLTLSCLNMTFRRWLAKDV